MMLCIFIRDSSTHSHAYRYYCKIQKFPPFYFILKVYCKATTSISTGTPLGNCLTATQLLAGLWLKCLEYSSFISAKSAISVKKTVTLTTFVISEPAAARTARTFWTHKAVFSWRVPVSRILPSASQGMQPDAKIKPWALMAWDF